MHPAQPRNNEKLLRCEAEGCKESMPLSYAHSFIVVYATTGIPGVPAQQCPAEQHYGCCASHALSALQRCLSDHLLPQYTQAVNQYQAWQAEQQAAQEAFQQQGKENNAS